MEMDMHYYATYVVARCVGLTEDVALRMASASQYTDDFTTPRWLREGNVNTCVLPSAMAQGVADPRIFDNILTEIPFHFLPGGEGESVAEKFVARRGGRGIQRMLEEVCVCRNTMYLPELMGLAAHALMDSYAHWGFSGMRGAWNMVPKESIRADMAHLRPDREESGTGRNARAFWFAFAEPKSEAKPTGNGHDDVGMLPDLPYMRWRCTVGGVEGARDNPDTYIQACHALHEAFCRFKQLWRRSGPMTAFVHLREPFMDVLSVREPSETCRSMLWQQVYGELFPGERIPDYAEHKAALDGDTPAFENFSRAVTYFRSTMITSVLPSLGLVLVPNHANGQ